MKTVSFEVPDWVTGGHFQLDANANNAKEPRDFHVRCTLHFDERDALESRIAVHNLAGAILAREFGDDYHKIFIAQARAAVGQGALTEREQDIIARMKTLETP